MAPQHDRTDAQPNATEESELLARLAALPGPALEATASRRIHRRARAAFVRESERAAHPWLAALARVYTRRIEPAMATAVAASYLVWAFQTVFSLYQ